MSSVPFYRRVFFGVFIVAFVVLAPAVVFYTAGYRWNAKKGMIERNGTLILDTVPTGASIMLNDQTLSDKTPVTLQNVAPGTYRIRLQRPGYSTWEKTLDVRPERVTFVNDVHLWRTSAPVLTREGDVRAVAVSPNNRYLAEVEGATGTARLVMEDVPGSSVGVLGPSVPSSYPFHGGAPTGTVDLVWNQASSAVLVRDGLEHVWIADRSGRSRFVERLPDGVYRWSGDQLVGVQNHGQVFYSVTNGVTTQAPLSVGVVDQDDVYQLIVTTGTSRLSVMERGRSGKRFELPSGHWSFAGRFGSMIFLTDGQTWIGFDPGASNPMSVSLPSDEPPLSLKRSRDLALLARGGGELWLEIVGSEPELLIRTGETLTGAAWAADGNHVFYATRQAITALALDTRGGRLATPVGTFDRIDGLASANDVLFVAGQHNGHQGVWSVDLR
jgi:hypothetical protein